MTLDTLLRKFEEFRATYGVAPNAILVDPDINDNDIPQLGLRIIYADGLRGITFALVIPTT